MILTGQEAKARKRLSYRAVGRGLFTTTITTMTTTTTTTMR